MLQFLTAHRDAPTDTPEARGRPLAARDKSFMVEEDKAATNGRVPYGDRSPIELHSEV